MKHNESTNAERDNAKIMKIIIFSGMIVVIGFKKKYNTEDKANPKTKRK